jgi:phage terminase small subunit
VAKLTDKQAQFVEEYLIDLNATQAAIRAGYSAKTAYSAGERLLRDVEIQKRLTKRAQDRAARTEITQDRVLKELGRLAFLDIRKAFDADGQLKAIHDLDDDTAAAISGIEVSEITSGENVIGSLKKIKLSDKKGSLELLGRHLQMWNDKLALMNKDGSPLLQGITVTLVKAAPSGD